MSDAKTRLSHMISIEGGNSVHIRFVICYFKSTVDISLFNISSIEQRIEFAHIIDNLVLYLTRYH